MPDRLGLQERPQPGRPGGAREVRRRRAEDPLDRAGGGPLPRGALVGVGAGQVEGVDVGVRTPATGRPRPASRSGCSPRRRERRRWPGSRRARPPAAGGSRDASSTTVLPLQMIGASTETSPSSGSCCGATAATTPVGSGTENAKNGPGDRVRAAEDGGDLVGPAGVVHQPVDGSVHGAAGPRPRPRHPRRPRAARRRRRGGPRASRRSGRSPGRGCRRWCPTSRRTPCGRRRPRPGRPCGSPARRWRGSRRRGRSTG